MPVVKFADVNIEDNLDKGSYQAEITKWKRTETKSEKLMVTLTYKVSAPERFKGTVINNRYVIGTPGVGIADEWGFLADDDFDTSLYGSKQLTLALSKAHVSMTERELGEALEDALGQELIIYVENEEYNGKLRPAIKGHYAIGEREPQVDAPTTADSPAVVTRLSQRRQSAPKAATVQG